MERIKLVKPMTNNVAIKVEHLSKRYRIGQYVGSGAQYKTLRESLTNAVTAPLRRLRQTGDGRSKTGPPSSVPGLPSPSSGQPSTDGFLWALKDVSFEVKQGEVLGIIGRNGAGKSTLLKVLTRITEPTEGRAELNGRVGSLLEVGTGFHPELTGRENVYLSGAILGMTRKEIDRKFDEIVDFSGVETYIDTPVKRYSSGMRVRLGFAVAAHLEPEILLIDEVLAVGDVGFQKKCLGKMGDVARGGRTVLFVSHNMQAIRALCPRSLLLKEGRIIADGPTADTVQIYHDHLRQIEVNADTDVMNPKNRRGSGAVRFTGIRTEDESGRECSEFMMGSTIRFVLSYQTFAPVDELYTSILLRSGISREVVTSARHLVSGERLSPGCTGSVVIEFPNVNLRPGEYPLYFWLGKRGRPFDVVDDLTIPLIIYTDKDSEDLDFDPARRPVGFFNIRSRMV